MLSAEDRLDILDLYARYNTLLDRRDPAWAGVFAPDGVLLGRTKVRGREELLAFVAGLRASAGDSVYKHTQHWVGNIELAADGEDVRGTCYVMRVSRNTQTDSFEVISAGWLADRFVKLDEGWRFAERSITQA